MGNYVRDTLLKGEAIIYEAKTTLWSYWLTLLIAFLCVAGAFVVDNYAIMWLLISFGIASILYVAVVLQTTELSVTNKRIVAKRGVLARHLIELRLDRIETIRISQTLIGRMLNYGSLRIAGSGNPVTPIGSISDPLEFRRVALEAQEEAASGSSIRIYSPEGSGSNFVAVATLVIVAVGLGFGFRLLSRGASIARKPVEIVEGSSVVMPPIRRTPARSSPIPADDIADQAERPIRTASFNTYENAKFGYQLLVPSTLEQVVNQSDENGERLVSPDSEASLVVFGANTSGESLDELYQRSLGSLQGEVGYHIASKNWFVISSKNGETLRYQKTFAGPRSSNTFIMTFSENEKAKYVPLIDAMEKSFRHGDLEQAW